MRAYSFLDKACLKIDDALRTLFATPNHSRPTPMPPTAKVKLNAYESKHAAGLMRVNHTGEVCAQALYSGQALLSRSEGVRQHLTHAAKEEGDHLHWCQTRLLELNSHTSYLNAIWYAGSFTIGMAAALVGDQWSLGFVAETEKQVVEHIERHLQKLPPSDHRSAIILEQMKQDENQHRNQALMRGAAELPAPIKLVMKLASTIMVKTAYWI